MEKKMEAKSEYWRERITEQERSGMSVQRFCEEQGLTEQSFIFWRKRLRKQQPMRFAVGGNRTGAAASVRRSRIWSWCWRRASDCESALA